MLCQATVSEATDSGLYVRVLSLLSNSVFYFIPEAILRITYNNSYRLYTLTSSQRLYVPGKLLLALR